MHIIDLQVEPNRELGMKFDSETRCQPCRDHRIGFSGRRGRRRDGERVFLHFCIEKMSTTIVFEDVSPSQS